MNKAILKLSSSIAYELVTFMQEVSGVKDSVHLRPPTSGGSTWTREAASRGGQSKRTQRRDLASIRKKIEDVTRDKQASQKLIELLEQTLKQDRKESRKRPPPPAATAIHAGAKRPAVEAAAKRPAVSVEAAEVEYEFLEGGTPVTDTGESWL
jgi:hypothetical protein